MQCFDFQVTLWNKGKEIAHQANNRKLIALAGRGDKAGPGRDILEKRQNQS